MYQSNKFQDHNVVCHMKGAYIVTDVYKFKTHTDYSGQLGI